MSSMCFRTYKKEIIHMNETSHLRKKVAFSHLSTASGTVGLDTGEGYIEVDFLQSCITFMPEERVPAGVKFNVICALYIRNT